MIGEEEQGRSADLRMAYLLGHNPRLKIFGISYGTELSGKHAADFPPRGSETQARIEPYRCAPMAGGTRDARTCASWTRRGFTAAEKTELWDRWKRGDSLKASEMGGDHASARLRVAGRCRREDGAIPAHDMVSSESADRKSCSISKSATRKSLCPKLIRFMQGSHLGGRGGRYFRLKLADEPSENRLPMPAVQIALGLPSLPPKNRRSF